MMKTSQQDIMQLQTTLSLLNTLQALEAYREFCYNLYLLATYEEQVEDNTEKQICYITLGGKTIGTHTEVKDTDYVQTKPPITATSIPMH